MVELTPFPSNFGSNGDIEGMVAWDIVVEMDDSLPALASVVERERAKLPLAPPGYYWSIVNLSDETLYDKATRKLSLHFGAVKEGSGT